MRRIKNLEKSMSNNHKIKKLEEKNVKSEFYLQISSKVSLLSKHESLKQSFAIKVLQIGFTTKIS